jgi:hypothetical protein
MEIKRVLARTGADFCYNVSFCFPNQVAIQNAETESPKRGQFKPAGQSFLCVGFSQRKVDVAVNALNVLLGSGTCRCVDWAIREDFAALDRGSRVFLATTLKISGAPPGLEALCQS